MRHAGRWIVLAVLFTLPAFGQSLGERIVARADALEKKIKCVVGVSVVELGGGAAGGGRSKSVAAHRAEELLVPASNMKIVTSMVAMRRLGADHAFATAVYLVGREVKDGEEVKQVQDVVVVGGFDPLLGDPRVAAGLEQTIYDDVDAWAGVIGRVSGGEVRDVIVLTDGSPKTYRHADWDPKQHHRWDFAPVAALNFNNNCIDMAVQADRTGARPLLWPESRLFTVHNRLGGKEAAWNLAISSGDTVLTVTGPARSSGKPQSYAVNDPPMLLARTLVDRLARAEVSVGGVPRAAATADVPLDQARLVARTATPLAWVLNRSNKNSLNMAAECMLLAAGDGTWGGSGRLAEKTLLDDFGLGERQVSVADGSGLGRNNRITPAAMTTLLTRALSMQGGEAFLASLAVSGTDGTLEKRLGGGAKGLVLAKTGSIRGVSCLSGYVLNPDGKPAYAFSVLVNKNVDLAAARALQDEICAMLVEAAK